MTKLYLIRHAEAEGNLYRRSQGQYNANVTQLGRRQIAALAERFRGIHIDALWSSDLNRAASTATAILKYHPDLTLHTTPRLREIGMGEWEDRPWGELEREWPEQMVYFSSDPARWHVPGGEDYMAVPARIEAALLELAEAYPGKTVAVVSHGLAIRSLLCKLKGIPSERISSLPYGDNTAVSLLTAEDGVLSIDWYNDSSHLGDTLSTFARQGVLKNPDGKKEDNWFMPLDLRQEEALYSTCYSQTWMASHGSLKGYAPLLYLHSAMEHAGADPQCLVKMYAQEEFAGLIELDPDRGREGGAGWISLLWVEPPFRGRRMGGQLIGHAVSYFRRQGRRTLRLHVSQTNKAALGFYEKCGFRRLGEINGVGGPLFLMEMDIAQRVWTLP